MTARNPIDFTFPPALPDRERSSGAGNGSGGAGGGQGRGQDQHHGRGLRPGSTELGSVLRGLSAIFWGLPVTLLAFARHFLSFLPSAYDLVLPSAGTLLLGYGVFRLSKLHGQERVWQHPLAMCQILAVILAGLSPFLFLWNRVPSEPFFARAVALSLGVALIFLIALSNTLARLAALLPDPATQADASLFASVTGYVGATLAAVSLVLYWRLEPATLSEFLSLPQQPVAHALQAFMLILALVPVAISMAVTWKLKEVVLAVLVSPRA